MSVFFTSVPPAFYQYRQGGVKSQALFKNFQSISGQMATNRTVYASPPVGGSASATARSFRCAQTFGLNIPALLLRHSLPALERFVFLISGLQKLRIQPER
jgi:hypothetical protein